MHHQSTLPLFTSEENRFCEACGKQLVRRNDEHRSTFIRRKLCGVECRGKAIAAMWERKRRAYLTAGEKRCTKCNKVKPLSAFRRGYGHPDARQSSCQACQREEHRDRYWSDPEAHRAYARAWQRRNPEKAKERWARYSRENRATLREKWKAYRVENRERRLQYDRQRRAATPPEVRRKQDRYYYLKRKRSGKYDRYMARSKEKRARYGRLWRQLCHMKNVDKENRRRARIRDVEIRPFERADVIKRDGMTCYICGQDLALDEVTLDHLIPISRGGAHAAENLAVCCQPCNSRKRDRLPEDMPRAMADKVERKIESLKSC